MQSLAQVRYFCLMENKMFTHFYIDKVNYLPRKFVRNGCDTFVRGVDEREVEATPGADEQELATPILSLCHGIFTEDRKSVV